MSAGYGVRVTNTKTGSSLERTFAKLPIRIGRNALNDLRLDLPFVSDFHAVIETQNGEIMLRDLGSTNGTMLRSTGRLQPNQVISLREHNYEFAIVSVVITVYSTQVEPEPTSARRFGVASYASPQVLESARPAPPPAATAHLQAYAAYRKGWTELMTNINENIGRYPPEQRVAALQAMAREMPALLQEPDFQRLAASLGSPIPHAPRTTTREEAVALQGLKELASELVPSRGTPESVDDLVLFLTKLREVLTIFLQTFVPLRDGYRQFRSDMEITGAIDVTGASQIVTRAKSPEELATGLLDWKSPVNDAPRAIEGTLADLMTHHVAMINGVMQGVKSLLNELSPQMIEQMLDDPNTRKPEGSTFGPFRFKSLWKLYEQRYGDLTSEEKHVFSLLFGDAFAQAYGRYQQSGTNRMTTRHISAVNNPTGGPFGASS
ncbi:MAG: FHA domain-containing protein [Myxococcales bacterium]|nr:FHA domain-containing protein [Myxococcales bacterium]